MPWTSPGPRLSEKLSLRQAPLPFLLSELDLILAPLASLEDILLKRLKGNIFGTLRPPAWTASLQQLEPWEEENARAPETLEEHLLPQIVLCPGIPENLSERLGEQLLLWVDSRGYLRGSDWEIAENLGIPLSSWKETLKNLQHWVDPPGLLARDLTECLLLQLRRRKKPSPEALELLEKYAPLLKEGNFEEIRKTAKWTPRQLERALEALRSLDSAPGNSFGTILYVQPEIEITLEEEVPKFHLLREYLPKITADREMLSWREEPRLQRQWKEFLRLNICLALRCRGRMLVTRKAGGSTKVFSRRKGRRSGAAHSYRSSSTSRLRPFHGTSHRPSHLAPNSQRNPSSGKSFFQTPSKPTGRIRGPTSPLSRKTSKRQKPFKSCGGAPNSSPNPFLASSPNAPAKLFFLKNSGFEQFFP